MGFENNLIGRVLGRMKVRKWVLLFVAVAMCTATEGCFRTMRDYQPQDMIGRQIREALLRFQEAYNQGDLNGVTECFAQYPVLEVDQEGPFPVGEAVGKEEIREAMSQAMSTSPKMGLGEPTIFLPLDSGNKAVLEAVSEFGGQILVAKFSMIREFNGWLIKKLVLY